jgi:hypothetical protein
MTALSLRWISTLLLLVASLLSACAPASVPTTPPVEDVATETVAPENLQSSEAPAQNDSVNNPQAGQPDDLSGLPLPAFSPRPAGAANPAPAPTQAGSAMLVIGGDLPLALSGGQCEQFEGDTYLNIPNTIDSTTPRASLVINGGDGLTRTGYLIWATSDAATDSATVSTQDSFVITLNEDGFSGRFDGTAHRITNNIPILQQIPVSGVFTCVASLLTVRGQHPVDLDGAQCELEPQFIMRAGQRGQNQVLLMMQAGSQAGESNIAAGISWNVGGVTYTSTWLIANRNADGLSGTYQGQATGPDGVPFEVQGTFNCLGG